MLLPESPRRSSDPGGRLAISGCAHLSMPPIWEYAIFHKLFERQGAGITEKPQKKEGGIFPPKKKNPASRTVSGVSPRGGKKKKKKGGGGLLASSHR